MDYRALPNTALCTISVSVTIILPPVTIMRCYKTNKLPNYEWLAATIMSCSWEYQEVLQINNNTPIQGSIKQYVNTAVF